jgi:hypothetical protein
LDSLPFWARVAAAPSVRFKLPLGASPDEPAGAVAEMFRAFLGRTDPGFTMFEPHDITDQTPLVPAGSFGLVDEAAKAVALYAAGELMGYGGPTAIRRFARAFAEWTKFGLPGMAAFGLEVCRTAEAPAGTGRRWVERRDETALVWSLPPDATAWRSLLEDVETSPTAGPE